MKGSQIGVTTGVFGPLLYAGNSEYPEPLSDGFEVSYHVKMIRIDLIPWVNAI